ncbi:DUF4167 domain-containing protein [Pseudolabrys taiwanensis]|uniref:DUF4167 domain-containing protein n=1 Tax=Pseudolabrys taiwanensis TaxID=331696 RepID=A0A345ZYR0_9HYPH|nr:DUF4167 domain-containing protein [Pseudolabrys taiwanensis]AXK82057.1 DUF4167 domain-containing protein [Pseudolabrys taiwanensis]
MRNGQKRMRGRNNGGGHRKSQNPLTRVYESNGPDVKIRGTASHIAEKYIQLARDAQSSGDPVAAENYYQHAEHYFRLIAAAQEQFRQQNPYYAQQQQPGTPQGAADDFDGDDEDGGQPTFMGQNEPSYAPQPQPYLPRDAQPFPPRDQQQHARPQQQPQQQPYPQPAEGDATGLPAFITGGGQPQPVNGTNGHEQGAGERGERFGHRRRRRHRSGFRGERQDFAGQGEGAESNQPE